MKEIKRLRPGTDPTAYKHYTRTALNAAIELLEPCKTHGRAHLVNIIGNSLSEAHNEMTLICAGAKKRPQDEDERVTLSIKAAVAGLLTTAALRCMSDPNTQWDDHTLFYYQLRNHVEQISEHGLKASLIVRL